MSPLEAASPVGPLLVALDLAGTAVFALSGAAVGVKYRLDVFGVCVLAVVAGTGGGIMRDVLLGAVPPMAIREWPYIAVALAAGVITFLWHGSVERLRDPILVFDAAGLALFAVAGTQKALTVGLEPIVAPLVGMLTGIGGGVLRDVLVSEIPTVLRSELYALAALAGAAVVVTGSWFQLPPAPTAAAGAVACFALRVVAIRRGWNLPKPNEERRSGQRR